MTGHDPRRKVLSALWRAIALETDVLAVHPDLTWQQLANRLQWMPGGPSELVASEAERRRAGWQTWMRLRTRFPESAALVRRLNPRSDHLSSCALTPNGELALTTGMDGTARVWRTSSGRQVRVLREAGQPVACAVTPDGRFALATGPDGTAHVWRIDDGQKIAEAVAHSGSANACAVTPDGSSVVTFGADGSVRVWRLPDLRPGDVLAEGAGHLTFGALSHDGTTVAYGNRESSQIELHGLRPDERPFSLDAGGEVTCCAFGTSPTLLLSGRADGTLCAWDTPSGRRRCVPAHHGEVLDCAVTTDGTLIRESTDVGSAG